MVPCSMASIKATCSNRCGRSASKYAACEAPAPASAPALLPVPHSFTLAADPCNVDDIDDLCFAASDGWIGLVSDTPVVSCTLALSKPQQLANSTPDATIIQGVFLAVAVGGYGVLGQLWL